MTPLRIGILGAGRIGRMHAELLTSRVAGTAVSAVYDVVGDAASDVAAASGADVAATPGELIGSDDVDAVAICSSTDTHIDLLVAAAAAGKPVFLEKPVSLDLDEVDRGIAAVDAAGIPVQVGFNRRWDASHRAVRDQVASGSLGDLHLLRITSRDPAPPPVEYIRTSGGIFCDMTIHDFDMARFVAGSEVVEVFARGAVRVDPAIGEAGDLDTVVVMMRHEHGALTTIDNSRQAVYGYDQRVEAFGAEGMAASENHLDHSMTTRNAAGAQLAPVQHFFLERYIPSYLAGWDAFVAMVRDGTPSPITMADGRAPLVLGLAARESASNGTPISIER